MSVKLLIDGIQSKKTVTIRISLDTGLTKVKSQINTKIVQFLTMLQWHELQNCTKLYNFVQYKIVQRKIVQVENCTMQWHELSEPYAMQPSHDDDMTMMDNRQWSKMMVSVCSIKQIQV